MRKNIRPQKSKNFTSCVEITARAGRKGLDYGLSIRLADFYIKYKETSQQEEMILYKPYPEDNRSLYYEAYNFELSFRIQDQK